MGHAGCIYQAAPVWSAGITESDSKQIERVLKATFAIILGWKYILYSHALGDLKMESVEVRRKSLCLSFAKKSQRHEKSQNWFQESDQLTQTTFQPVPYRTKRYKTSPLPYLTSLLNDAI